MPRCRKSYPKIQQTSEKCEALLQYFSQRVPFFTKLLAGYCVNSYRIEFLTYAQKIFMIYIFLLTLFYYLCECISSAEVRYGFCGRVCRHFIEKRLLTLFLGFRNLENFNHCQEWCNSRCLYANMNIPTILVREYQSLVVYYILREASALLVL